MKRFLFVLLMLISATAVAQSFRYIDESGNLHWVDSINQVPPRYRDQLMEPTPAPTGKVKHVHATPVPKPTRTPKPRKTPKPKKTPAPKKPTSFFPGSYGGSAAAPTPVPGRPVQQEPQKIIAPTPAPEVVIPPPPAAH